MTAGPPPSDVPAGWYSDPDWPNTERYWDGGAWTDQRREERAQPEVAPSRATARTSAPPQSVSTSGSVSAAIWAAGICTGLVAIGSLGPWATSALESTTGLVGDGKISLGLAIVAAIALGFYVSEAGPGRAIVIAICGALAALVGVIDLVDIESRTTRAFGREVDLIAAGWGLYVLIAAGAGLLVSGILLRAQGPRR